jgi:SAM-dependent methyltransferase
MTVALTTTWYPRGELPRLQRLSAALENAYQHRFVVLPPDIEPDLLRSVESLGFSVVVAPDWSWGRYLALQQAGHTDADWIHYSDMDRLIHWVETRPEEWSNAVDELHLADCTCFGRTSAAYATHPKALVETERSSNLVISHLLGQTMDVSAGSKGFSKKAALFLSENTEPGASMGMDAAWLVLLNRAGYRIRYREVNGLDWESADQYRAEAANEDIQRQAAITYDADPGHWEWRSKVAFEVIQAGIKSACQPIDEKWLHPSSHFEVNDYLHFYGEFLTDERSERETNQIIDLLELKQPSDILDLACGFGRHTNRLALRGHHLTGIDIEPGFLDKAKRDAIKVGVTVDYRQEDMREMTFKDRFDCVLLLFTSFGYFIDDENQKILEKVGCALRKGGQFLMDIPNRPGFITRMAGVHVDEAGSDLMVNRSSYDENSQRWYNRRVVIRNGVRKDKPFNVRLYDLGEIQAMLEIAGMKQKEVYSGFNREPFMNEASRMVILARKTG